MKRSLILILLLTTALLLLCACGGRSISADLDSGSKRETEETAASEQEDTPAEKQEEDRMENADTPAGHPADSGEKLGEPIRTAWLDAIDESGSAPAAPDAAGILSAALAENPGLSAAELEEILLSALESGSYEMAELPACDGTDEAYLDALEVTLAQLWIEALSESELQPITVKWGG